MSSASVTVNGSYVFLSTSATSTSKMLIGRNPVNNESIISQTNVGGLLRIMPGKTNPQVFLGDGNTAGSGFIDVGAARPLYLQGLSSGTVNISNLQMESNSTMTIVGSLVINGTGAPSAGFALCINAATSKWGHCTNMNTVTGACTCAVP